MPLTNPLNLDSIEKFSSKFSFFSSKKANFHFFQENSSLFFIRSNERIDVASSSVDYLREETTEKVNREEILFVF